MWLWRNYISEKLTVKFFDICSYDKHIFKWFSDVSKFGGIIASYIRKS